MTIILYMVHKSLANFGSIIVSFTAQEILEDFGLTVATYMAHLIQANFGLKMAIFMVQKKLYLGLNNPKKSGILQLEFRIKIL